MTEKNETTPEKEEECLFDGNLKDFKGKDFFPITNLRDLILNVLGVHRASGAEAIKAFDIGVKIANKEHLKSEGIVLLRQIIENSENISILAKAQILTLIKNK